MPSDASGKERSPPGRFFLASLSIAMLTTSLPGIVPSLFLINMAQAFGTTEEIMGQASALSSAVGVVTALLMGAWSIRFRHKTLLATGLIIITASALACFLAPNLASMFVVYALGGAGIAMVAPMAYALVGEYLPLEKRAKAVGLVVAGGSLAYFLGAPAMALIADFGGWRSAFLGIIFPVSSISLLLAIATLPSMSPKKRQQTRKTHTYTESFKEVLFRKSSAACVVGNVLRLAQFMAIMIYYAPFVQDRFSLSVGASSIFILVAALAYTIGSIAGGPVVERFRRKPTTVVSLLLASVFTILFTYPPDLWLSSVILCLGAFFSGMATSAATSLSLEQVPEFRGTMMSMNSVAVSLGSALGASIGGFALAWSYNASASILGALGILAAIVFHLLTTDPTCSSQSSP